MKSVVCTPARCGGSFLKFLLAVAVLTSIAVLGYGVYANWDIDRDGDGEGDGFTMRVLDPDWWTASRERARGQVDELGEWAIAKKEDIWGAGGYIDQGEELVSEFASAREAPANAGGRASEGSARAEGAEGSRTAPTDDRQDSTTDGGAVVTEAAPSPSSQPTAEAVDTGVSPRTQRLEERIANAELHFTDGLEAYRAADPSQGWTPERLDRLAEAQDHFEAVRRLLIEQGTLDDYAALGDHDPQRLERAREMIQLSQRLLHASQKSGGGL